MAAPYRLAAPDESQLLHHADRAVVGRPRDADDPLDAPSPEREPERLAPSLRGQPAAPRRAREDPADLRVARVERPVRVVHEAEPAEQPAGGALLHRPMAEAPARPVRAEAVDL